MDRELTMTPQELLQECETLTHHGRMRRMVELGQLAASDPSISVTLAAFAQGDVYQRILSWASMPTKAASALVARALCCH
jgi:hypothetical protein